MFINVELNLQFEERKNRNNNQPRPRTQFSLTDIIIIQCYVFTKTAWGDIHERQAVIFFLHLVYALIPIVFSKFHPLRSLISTPISSVNNHSAWKIGWQIRSENETRHPSHALQAAHEPPVPYETYTYAKSGIYHLTSAASDRLIPVCQLLFSCNSKHNSKQPSPQPSDQLRVEAVKAIWSDWNIPSA